MPHRSHWHRRPSPAAIMGTLAVAMMACGCPVAAQAAEGSARTLEEPCARTETFARPAVNGPFDYRNERSALRMLESNHFVPQIENLVRGRTGTLAQELSFVLHGFPNHHRALAAIVRYSLREKSLQPKDMDYSVDCYFQRALVFRPDDHIVRMLFADYLVRTQRVGLALPLLEQVRSMSKDNPLTQHNLGLLYFEAGRYPEALALAHESMAQGMARTDLRDKLQAKGQWKDPPTASDSAASAPRPPA